MHVASAEPVRDIASADALQDCGRRRRLCLAASRIGAPGVSFEIRGEGQRAQRRLFRNRQCAAIGEMIYQRQRRDKLPILGQMAFQSRR